MTTYPNAPLRLVDGPGEYGRDIPQSKLTKQKLDEWLSKNVVSPWTKMGYPNVGAGLATVPSTLAELVLPENTGELAPGMAGVGKLGRKAKRLEKDLRNVSPEYLLKRRDELEEEINKLIKEFPAVEYTDFSANKDIKDKYDKLFGDLSVIEHNIAFPHRLKSDVDHLNWLQSNTKDSYKKIKEFGERRVPVKSMADLMNIPLGGSEESILKSINNRLKDTYSRVSSLHDVVFGPQTKPYLRPKGYANQPKQTPQSPWMAMPTREDYDQMLKGPQAGQQYFDDLSKQYYNELERQNPTDPLEELIKKSWKGE